MAQEDPVTEGVVVSEVSKPRFRFIKKILNTCRTAPKRVKILGLVVVLCLMGATTYLYIDSARTNDATDGTQVDEAALSAEIQKNADDYNARVEAAAKNPITPESQYSAAQQAVNELSSPNDAQSSLQVYIDAAFAGALVDSPDAKAYAAKALELYPQDEETQSFNANQISKLKAIAEGNYKDAQ